jgi:phosphotransferase system HPr (HPr) family protein
MADKPSSRVVTVHSPQGLHARPAHMLVNLAKQYKSGIEIIRDGESADGKSILSILTLAAEQGVQLTIRATGEDADEALDALAELFDSGFRENGDQAQEQESHSGG